MEWTLLYLFSYPFPHVLGSAKLEQSMAKSVEVEFALLELLVAPFVEGQSALAVVLFAALVAALHAAHLKGQAFLSLFPPLHPLCLCLYLSSVLM